jgi:NhaA family Na+:H+ antiporter
MSLFVGSLAFEQGGPDFAVDDRLGILLGSLASGLLGYGVLHFFSSHNSSATASS